MQVQSIGRGWYPCVSSGEEARGGAQTSYSSDAVPVHFQFPKQVEGLME